MEITINDMARPRSYSSGTRAALALLSNGSCYYPGCSKPTIEFLDGEPFVACQIAHIRDARPGNRFDPEMSDDDRRSFQNLILLCKPHHTLVDKSHPERFSTADLGRWKFAKEERFLIGTRGVSISDEELIGGLQAAALRNQALQRIGGATIDPTPLYDELGLSEFVGRVWLVEAFDAFISSNHSGYFVLEAGAGLGKSTFLAWLSKTRGYLAHFTRLVDRPSDPQLFVANLAGQVTSRFDLDPKLLSDAIERSSREISALPQLLELACKARDEQFPDEPIVVLVDGLDEVQAPAGRNPLNLPEHLPDGVFFLVAQRPSAQAIRTDSEKFTSVIEPNGDLNKADMRAYLDLISKDPAISQELRLRSYTAPNFIEALFLKCEGVWIYLRYIIREIREGRRSPLDLGQLPQGIAAYYTQYWSGWRDEHEDDWYENHLPLLAVLAAHKEPISPNQARTLARLKTGIGPIRRLLSESWGAYLTSNRADDTFALYHQSMREFFSQETGGSAFERELSHEIRSAYIEANVRIGNYYLDKWNRKGGLVHLAAVGEFSSEDQYGIRNLIEHLVIGGQAESVAEVLMATQDTGIVAGSIWHEVHRSCDGEFGYLVDIESAYSYFERPEVAENIGIDRSFGVLIYLAISAGCVHSLVRDLPGELAAAHLVTHNWSPRKALGMAVSAEQISGIDTVMSLVPFLPKEERKVALRRCLDVSRGDATPPTRWHYPPDHLRVILSDEEEREALDYCVKSLVANENIDYRFLGTLLGRIAELGLSEDQFLPGQLFSRAKSARTYRADPRTLDFGATREAALVDFMVGLIRSIPDPYLNAVAAKNLSLRSKAQALRIQVALAAREGRRLPGEADGLGRDKLRHWALASDVLLAQPRAKSDTDTDGTPESIIARRWLLARLPNEVMPLYSLAALVGVIDEGKILAELRFSSVSDEDNPNVDGLLILCERMPPDSARAAVQTAQEALEEESLLGRLPFMFVYDRISTLARLAMAASSTTRSAVAETCLDLLDPDRGTRKPVLVIAEALINASGVASTGFEYLIPFLEPKDVDLLISESKQLEILSPRFVSYAGRYCSTLGQRALLKLIQETKTDFQKLQLIKAIVPVLDKSILGEAHIVASGMGWVDQPIAIALLTQRLPHMAANGLTEEILELIEDDAIYQRLYCLPLLLPHVSTVMRKLIFSQLFRLISDSKGALVDYSGIAAASSRLSVDEAHRLFGLISTRREGIGLLETIVGLGDRAGIEMGEIIEKAWSVAQLDAVDEVPDLEPLARILDKPSLVALVKRELRIHEAQGLAGVLGILSELAPAFSRNFSASFVDGLVESVRLLPNLDW